MLRLQRKPAHGAAAKEKSEECKMHADEDDSWGHLENFIDKLACPSLTRHHPGTIATNEWLLQSSQFSSKLIYQIEA